MIGNMVIHLEGNTSMVVEECQKVVEYSDVYIALKSHELKVYVWGERLRMDSFGIGNVKVRGEIHSVEFAR